MVKTGRRKGRRDKGYFYRKGRGWVTSDEGSMVPLTFPDGTGIRDRQAEESTVKEAHARWLVAKQAAKEVARIHLESAAARVPEAYLRHLLAHQPEHVAEAARLDQHLGELWSGHPRYVKIEWTPDIAKKLSCGLALVRQLLASGTTSDPGRRPA